jgi:hypothetical protein
MAYTTINKPSEYFNTKLYTGTGAENALTSVGFQPDLTWIKRREINDHRWFDAVRGATKYIESSSTDAEVTDAQELKSFDSDGFTLGTALKVNASGGTYASWNWLADNTSGSSNTDGSITSTVSASTTSGFSIVKWTGDGSASGAKTVGHSLGVTPKFVIAKKTSASASWWVGIDIDGWNWNTDYINLNSASAKQSDASGTVFYSAPTSLIINLGSEINASSAGYIAYCFAEKKGFSKFGSYTGNGNADGTFVYTGFKPAFLLYKCSSDNSTNWQVFDNKRSTYNLAVNRLNPNDASAELATTADSFDLLSNGFKARNNGANSNNSGSTFIYMAFAENPLVGTNNIPATAR